MKQNIYHDFMNITYLGWFMMILQNDRPCYKSNYYIVPQQASRKDLSVWLVEHQDYHDKRTYDKRGNDKRDK